MPSQTALKDRLEKALEGYLKISPDFEHNPSSVYGLDRPEHLTVEFDVRGSMPKFQSTLAKFGIAIRPPSNTEKSDWECDIDLNQVNLERGVEKLEKALRPMLVKTVKTLTKEAHEELGTLAAYTDDADTRAEIADIVSQAAEKFSAKITPPVKTHAAKVKKTGGRIAR